MRDLKRVLVQLCQKPHVSYAGVHLMHQGGDAVLVKSWCVSLIVGAENWECVRAVAMNTHPT